MITQIAWRNIWRNKLRSGLVMLSIALGIWAGVFLIAFSFGLNQQRTDSAIRSTLSHLQIHNPDFEVDPLVSHWIPNFDKTEETLLAHENVEAFSSRILLFSMISSPATASGVRIAALSPEREKTVTDLHTKLVDGTWWEEGKPNRILIGEKLAERLNVKVKNRVVLTFQDEENQLITAAFRVGGIFTTLSSRYDEMNAFVRIDDVENLLGTQNKAHEIAVILKDPENIDATAESLKTQLPEVSVRTWREISPELGYADDVLAQMLFLFVGIILLALSFGVVNNMLMAVLERKRELGVLMAVGMNKRKVFRMIVLETVMLALVGAPVGMLLGRITVAYTSRYGIDLNVFGDGLASFGVQTVVHPSIPGYFYFGMSVMVAVMALLASIYPARKALKLNPTEAMRSI